MRVLRINPIQSLVVPRVLAGTLIATMLEGVVAVVGLTGAFAFSVFFQHVTAGAFISSLTTIVGTPDVIISLVKAMFFGLAASLNAC